MFRSVVLFQSDPSPWARAKFFRQAGRKFSNVVGISASLLALNCCTYLPYDGPRTESVQDAGSSSSMHGIEVVPVNYAIASALTRDAEDQSFSSLFTGQKYDAETVASGDTLNVFIWEAAPAMLFAPASGAETATNTATSMVELPPQMVNSDGNIVVPFVGQVHAAGLAPTQVAALIQDDLQGRANQPQVLVQIVTNKAQAVTVVGSVKNSMEVPIVPGGVRLLDVLAEAGGVVGPVGQVAIQLSRDGQDDTLPLQTILGKPSENVYLQPGDVVTALNQPLKVTVLGATGSSKVIDFNKGSASLVEILGQAGGLQDNTANPAGVFVFRFINPKALLWPKPPTHLVNGEVPTIFAFNLRDPATFFAAQAFQMQNQDLVYVSEAPVMGLQKMLNVVAGIAYPFSTLYNYGALK